MPPSGASPAVNAAAQGQPLGPEQKDAEIARLNQEILLLRARQRMQSLNYNRAIDNLQQRVVAVTGELARTIAVPQAVIQPGGYHTRRTMFRVTILGLNKTIGIVFAEEKYQLLLDAIEAHIRHAGLLVRPAQGIAKLRVKVLGDIFWCGDDESLGVALGLFYSSSVDPKIVDVAVRLVT